MSTTFPLPELPRFRDVDPIVRNARVATDAPRVPWDVFTRDKFQWQPGEHVSLIGPTGLGKTTLLLNLLPFHPYVVVFATKPRDDTMERLVVESGYQKLETWRSIPARDMPRRILWPNAKRIDAEERQRAVFRDAFDRIYREGGWTVALDELWFITNKLNLKSEIETYYSQARSLGISVIAGTQRPAYVPLMMYDQATHLFLWRSTDVRNLQRLSEINAANTSAIRNIVANLDKFQVLYVNTRDGQMFRTRTPIPKRER